ncbi:MULTISPECIES: ribosome maturation factor RimM [unclassified Roseofilum]|uniref:ribosome maturation factor RimM n=1 Tax=unclassified Roseofilum TaxID=2620099 RepID=UPI000E7E4C8E|nr:MULTISPECIES: ribosome maturation factor RimM [unclassified Roseofilum]HBR00701.1 ribosome maturation factor RimM [Cyanobacteria bacterium UBA11691]MBP0009901.1 ribosome maturation factor RimM [Roseofilum sp. Belize Diploria]MBP0015045.1 ribosome maturation factor RimM [Roseofilum sp. SID3]MBP0034762.1 ribosome maturation factor RimM [Roseofilum sp. Belize BBD 4]MBP0037992.1 ribosome maturation factor RimM [Roseofilum sp. SID1]
MSQNEWIEIGHIVAAQGLDGQVRVYPDSDFPERFLEPGMRWIQRLGEKIPQPIELLDGRLIPGKGLYVLTFDGIDTRDRAEALKKAKLFVPVSDRPQLEDNEYHVQDLLGLDVWIQETGENLGVVIDLITAGNDLLEIKLLNQKDAADPEESEVSPKPIPSRKSKIKKPRRQTNRPKTVLIPFVKEIVPVVDLEKGKIEITPPEGLIE